MVKNLYKVYFKSGLVLNIIAESLTYTRSNLNDTIISYTFRGVEGTIPRYLQPNEIIAITQEPREEDINDTSL